MDKIAGSPLKLLNHVETQYRPGEREIAIKLVEALGCAVSDTGFKGDGDISFLAVHPKSDDLSTMNNAFYMSPMRPEQQAVEARLRRIYEEDPELQAGLAGYRKAAKSTPFGVAHFALRYATTQEVQQAADKVVESLGATLGERLHVRVFHPQDADSAKGKLVQGFIYQDVIVSGSFLYGQLIELQAEPGAIKA